MRAFAFVACRQLEKQPKTLQTFTTTLVATNGPHDAGITRFVFHSVAPQTGPSTALLIFVL